MTDRRLSAGLKVGAYLAAAVALTLYVVEWPQDSLVARLVTFPHVLALTGQHLAIVALSSVLAILTAVPLGLMLTRDWARQWTPRVVGFVNVCQTVPSLAVVALAVGLLGIGATTAIVALWLYALLPILNNTLTGLDGVDAATLQAARGMGMRPGRVLRRIEVPLALPLIVAGVRTAVTVNIGSAILAAFVGGGGLGDLIIAGNNISRVQVVVLGAGLPMLMALIVDALFDVAAEETAG
ncbi:MAG: ABC transporter permease [Ancalomicrobiaceae bacterium]|nr:ABC transporter permease [Ancalomicrobiaceae bacterium]